MSKDMRNKKQALKGSVIVIFFIAILILTISIPNDIIKGLICFKVAISFILSFWIMLSLLYIANISNSKFLEKISEGLSVIINLIYKPIITRLILLMSISYIFLFILLPFLIGFILPWENNLKIYISLSTVWALYTYFNKAPFFIIDCFFRKLASSSDLEINQKIQKAIETSKYLLSDKVRRSFIYLFHAVIIILINIISEIKYDLFLIIETPILGSISTFYAIDRVLDTFKETKHKFCITKKRLTLEVRNDLRTFKKIE